MATAAAKKGKGYALSGHKAVAWHAGAADRLIVSARTAGKERDENGISLFLVDPKAMGVTIRDYATNDGQRAGEVILEGVEVGAGDMLGKAGGAYPVIAAAVDRAMIALGAEACGAMAALVEQTQEYLKTRQQFGVPLSKFQVLQHRLVEMFNEQAMSRAVVLPGSSDAWRQRRAEPRPRGGGGQGPDRQVRQVRRPACGAAPWRHGHDRRVADRALFQAPVDDRRRLRQRRIPPPPLREDVSASSGDASTDGRLARPVRDLVGEARDGQCIVLLAREQ